MLALVASVPVPSERDGPGYPAAVRATRVLYVENDPALRGVIGSILGARDDLELIGTFSSSREVLASEEASRADVALLDLALGEDSLNGTELGLVLRERNPNMGVVIFTQHVVPDFASSLPKSMQWGWSFIEKRGDLDFDWLADVLRSTARGLNIVDPAVERARAEASDNPVAKLTARQREILALASTGIDATAIADQLGLAAASVRQELSRAYAVLVPDPSPGTDLRTSAVLRYLRETRTYAAEAGEH